MSPGGVAPAVDVLIACVSIVLLVVALIAASSVAFAFVPRLCLATCLGASVLGLMGLLGAEVLNLAGRFTPTWLMAGGWVTACLLGATAVRRRAVRPYLRHWHLALRSLWGSGVAARVSIVLLTFMGAATFLTGATTAPNNIDSLAYHLPRIMQWLQAGRIKLFDTPYPAQTYLAPGAEFLDAMLYSSLRTDHAMFLTQWISWWVIGLSAYAAARSLSASRKAALLGSVVVLSAPAVVGEAATTQNDLVATAFVMVALALLAHERAAAPAEHWPAALAVVMIGGAVSAKPPVAIFGIPLLIWALAIIIRSRSPKVFATAAVCAALAICVNSGWMLRNVTTYGSPTGPNVGLTVEADYLTSLAHTGVKNLGHQIALPGPQAANTLIADTLGVLASSLSGAPVHEADFSFTPEFSVKSERNEDRAANLLQFLLIAAAATIIMGRRPLRQAAWPAVVALLTGYALYSALIRYQTWGGRLMLPLLAEGAVLVALALSRSHLTQKGFIAPVIAGFLLLQATPWLLAQKWRPLVGTNSTVTRGDIGDVMAAFSPDEKDNALRTIHKLTADRPRSLGLAGKSSYYGEYLWWRSLQNGDDTPRIEHVDLASLNTSTAPDIVLSPWEPVPHVPAGYTVDTSSGMTLLIRST